MESSLTFITNLLQAIAWPAVAVFIIHTLKTPLGAFLARSKSLKLKVPGGTEINISNDQAEKIVQSVLDSVDDLLAAIENSDRELLTTLWKRNPQPLADIYPNFQRTTATKVSAQHETLRRLRRCGLLRPVEGSTWAPSKTIELTPFGLLILELKQKDILHN